jgi:hypothetical protein
MSLWIDILALGAQGRSSEARTLLALDLPLSLRELPETARGGREYRGVLPQAVRRFSFKLPEAERSLLRSLETEFVDYLLDDVIAGVEEPLNLIELCLIRPEASLAELVDLFPWREGLKRSVAWKESRLADHLRSLLATGILLPPKIVETLAERGSPDFTYDERAYAASPKRLELSWKDFKVKQEYGLEFLGIGEDEAGDGVAGEGADYGVIPMADVALRATDAKDMEMELDLQLLGRSLSEGLAGILEEVHIENPSDGYRPVAWHNVFWELISEYERMRLSLETRDPYSATDQKLADHIKNHYPEVKRASRPMILRRRKKLSGLCVILIERRFWERFFAGREQSGSRITHANEEVNP